MLFWNTGIWNNNYIFSKIRTKAKAETERKAIARAEADRFGIEAAESARKAIARTKAEAERILGGNRSFTFSFSLSN